LVAATLAPDDAVADALEEAAAKAVSQRSYGIAATLYERAAALSEAPAARPGRLFAAGLAAVPAGRVDESIRLLGEALALTDDPLTRVRIEHQLCELQLWQHAPLAARDRLLELAARVEEQDRGLASRMVLSAAQASIVMYDQAAVADAASWAARLAVGSRPLELAASVIRAFAETQAGHGVRAAEILDDCQAGLGEEDPLAIGQVVLQAAVCELALERFDQAHALLDLIVQRARDAGAGGSLAMQLPWAALLDLADGRWMDALAEAHEAVHLIEETGWDGYRPMAFSVLARVEAGMGRPECVGHANSAIAAADQLGASPMEAHAHAALGFYHLGLQAWTAAADEFEEALRLASFSAAPLLRVQFLPDLIEANFRAARTGRAAELMAEFDDIAAQMQRPSAVVLAARCRGLLALGDPESEFRKALDGGDATVPRFERARTALYYGDVLRRAKRRSEAKVQFRRAFEEFERLGAAPWAERAGKWLDPAATNRSEQGRLQLTPQELQVALAVSKGMKNSEVAAALFLSVKTVEYHLRHVFEKVGVRSRTELVPRMTTITSELSAAGAASSRPG
jgi:DNA-binding CsgD family transcriptional regulator